MNLFQFLAQNFRQVLQLTLEHLWLVGVSTVLAALIGIPLGILIAHRPVLNRPVLGGANIIQTIPSLALFGFLLPVPWLGDRAERLAILALTLYALLPVIRNTFTGIRGVDPAVVESARGMGMTGRQLLWQVELPLAMSVILSGVRVAVVISVGLATIAAAIGAGAFHNRRVRMPLERAAWVAGDRREFSACRPALRLCQPLWPSGTFLESGHDHRPWTMGSHWRKLGLYLENRRP